MPTSTNSTFAPSRSGALNRRRSPFHPHRRRHNLGLDFRPRQFECGDPGLLIEIELEARTPNWDSVDRALDDEAASIALRLPDRHPPCLWIRLAGGHELLQDIELGDLASVNSELAEQLLALCLQFLSGPLKASTFKGVNIAFSLAEKRRSPRGDSSAS